MLSITLIMICYIQIESVDDATDWLAEATTLNDTDIETYVQERETNTKELFKEVNLSMKRNI